jgi:hypothetical protein
VNVEIPAAIKHKSSRKTNSLERTLGLNRRSSLSNVSYAPAPFNPILMVIRLRQRMTQRLAWRDDAAKAFAYPALDRSFLNSAGGWPRSIAAFAAGRNATSYRVFRSGSDI